MGRAGREHQDALARRQVPVDDPDVGDDAAVGVVDAVEDHRPRRRIGVADRGGHHAHDLVEQLGDALARLGADPQHVIGVAADDVRELGGVLLRLRRRQVDLVEHRDDVQVVLEREVEVGQRLGLDALGGVDEQHGALAGGERAGHLVGEVDVTGRVDHVQDVYDALGRRGRGPRTADRPRQPDRLALDGDAALALDVHAVEVLRAHRALVDHAGELQHAVGQRRLAVVDVGDDAEVADQRRVGAARGRLTRGQALGHAGSRRMGVERGPTHPPMRGPPPPPAPIDPPRS